MVPKGNLPSAFFLEHFPLVEMSLALLPDHIGFCIEFAFRGHENFANQDCGHSGSGGCPTFQRRCVRSILCGILVTVPRFEGEISSTFLDKFKDPPKASGDLL